MVQNVFAWLFATKKVKVLKLSKLESVKHMKNFTRPLQHYYLFLCILDSMNYKLILCLDHGYIGTR